MPSHAYRDPKSLARLPENMRFAIVMYIEHGYLEVGDFLEAVVSNDFREAVMRADEDNCRALVDWGRYLYEHAPSACWGSIAKVATWCEKGGLYGHTDPAPASISSSLANLAGEDSIQRDERKGRQ